MPTAGDVHVVYHKAGKVWKVDVTGKQRASGSHATKPRAVTQARHWRPETRQSSSSTIRIRSCPTRSTTRRP